MKFIMMHATNAHWESGAKPTPEVIARVGEFLGPLVQSGVLQGGEGLRASSLGARVRSERGRCEVTPGPFKPAAKTPPAGFEIVRVASLDEAVRWSRRIAEILGDAFVDVRPVNEAWDIGVAPKPEGLTTTRYLAAYSTPASEGGSFPTSEQRTALSKLREEMRSAGVLLKSATMWPSAKGARLSRSKEKIVVTDGPFAEAKELIGGYGIVEVASLAEAKDIAQRYLGCVDTDEVDIRVLEEPA